MKKDLEIKVCGMRDEKNIRALLALKPDYIGFIFYEGSQRNVSELNLFQETPDVKRVGVFVNSALDFIQLKIKEYRLDLVQLHGNESPRFCKSLNKEEVEIIKVFSVGNDFDFGQTADYVEYCDFFLFDTKGKDRGGNGVQFNWSLLSNYDAELPFFLSGGIGVDDATKLKLLSFPKLKALDINSRFEKEVGLKDIELLKTFIDEIRG